MAVWGEGGVTYPLKKGNHAFLSIHNVSDLVNFLLLQILVKMTKSDRLCDVKLNLIDTNSTAKLFAYFLLPVGRLFCPETVQARGRRI
jgi:hypothetical protein